MAITEGNMHIDLDFLPESTLLNVYPMFLEESPCFQHATFTH